MSRRDSWDEDVGLYEGHRWDMMLMCDYGVDIINAAGMMTAGKMKVDSDQWSDWWKGKHTSMVSESADHGTNQLCVHVH